jgi:hypothetical protein
MMSQAFKTGTPAPLTLHAMDSTAPPAWHLAQVNIAKLTAPLEAPEMAGFFTRIDEINALADGSAGFVWRLQTPDGDATQLRVFPDDSILVNMSVWTSLEALRAFVFQSRHVELLRDRARWFPRLATPSYALWWIPAGTLPTVEDAQRRLALVAAQGPTREAFVFHRAFEPT